MKILDKRKQQGFTVIELIVVLVIIGILASLIVFSYNGVRSRDRDALRQSDIDTLQGHLEIFYAENSRYPTLSQLNKSEWLTKNIPDLSLDTLQDPSWTNAASCTNQNGQAKLVELPVPDCYAYSPTSAAGEDCDNNKTPCAHYTLTATLETEEEYIKTSLN